VRDVAAVVEATERKGRDDASWLGGVDVHHVFLEGLHPTDDGAWRIAWGS